MVGVALATVAVLLLLATRDGYHRDELYFLEASRHLALGYVDQPPLSVLGVWLSRTVFGDTSLLGLRVLPALLDGDAVLLTGLIARELGAGRFAQTLAALCSAVSGYLIIGHLAGPTAYDLRRVQRTQLILVVGTARAEPNSHHRHWLRRRLSGAVLGPGHAGGAQPQPLGRVR